MRETTRENSEDNTENKCKLFLAVTAHIMIISIVLIYTCMDNLKSYGINKEKETCLLNKNI